MLLLLADGTRVPVTELPGAGPWTFVVLGLPGAAESGAGGGAGVLVGAGDLGPAALEPAADQPWAWRALLLAPPDDRPVPAADLDRLDLPVLVVEGADQLEAVEGLLGRLGGGPGWAGIAPDAPHR